MSESRNRRILVIDDNESIHADFRKILGPKAAEPRSHASLKAAFFGTAPGPSTLSDEGFEIDAASQGKDGLEKARRALEEKRPFAVAFVDIRMPPGWDGVQTIERLWALDTELQTVICTAYSDYSWEQTVERLGRSDRLLVLKKPFDAIEIAQLATALTEKWASARHERELVESLRRAEREARSYASSLETMNRALATAKAAADKSSHLKSHFLLHLNDQVNVHFRRLLAQLDLLRRPEKLNPDELGLLDAILDVSRTVLSTCNDILDLTQLDSGEVVVESARCSVATLVDEALGSARARAERKGLELKAEFGDAIPETILTDGPRLRRILVELLENAVDFTERGSVRVRLRAEPCDDWEQSRIRFDVCDTGCGISEENRGKVFEPFFRTDPPGVFLGDRAGLGLSLAQRLARRLGGDLTLETAPGEGSVFSLTLETRSAPPVPVAPRAAPAPAPSA